MNDEHDLSSSSATPVVAATALATIVLATAIWRRHSVSRDSQLLKQKLHEEEEVLNVSNSAAMETDVVSKSSRSKERRRRGKDPIKELLKGGKKAKEISKLINSIHLEALPSLNTHTPDPLASESTTRLGSSSFVSYTDDSSETAKSDVTPTKEHEEASAGAGVSAQAIVGPSSRPAHSPPSGDSIPSLTILNNSSSEFSLPTAQDSQHHHSISYNIPTLSLQSSFSLPATSEAETSSALNHEYPSPKLNTDKPPRFRSKSRGETTSGSPQTGVLGNTERMSTSVSMLGSVLPRIVPGSEAWSNSETNGNGDGLDKQHVVEGQKVNGKPTEPLPSGTSLKRGRKRNKSPSMTAGPSGTTVAPKSSLSHASSSTEAEPGTTQPSTPSLSTQTQLASLRGALEAARLREEKARGEIDTLKWETELARRREAECHAYMQYLTQQLHSYASILMSVQGRQAAQQQYGPLPPSHASATAHSRPSFYGARMVHSPSGSLGSGSGSSGSGSIPGSGSNTNAHSSPNLFNGQLPLNNFHQLSRSGTPSSLGAPPLSATQSDPASDTSTSSLPTPTPSASLPSPPPSETASNSNSVSSPDASSASLPPVSQIYSTPHSGGADSSLSSTPHRNEHAPLHIPPPIDPVAFPNSPSFASPHFPFPPYHYPVSPYHQLHLAGPSHFTPMIGSPSSAFFAQSYDAWDNGSFMAPQRPPSASHFSPTPMPFSQSGQGSKSKSRSKGSKKPGSQRGKERPADVKDKDNNSPSAVDLSTSESTSAPDSPSLVKMTIADGEHGALASTSTPSTSSAPSSPSSSSPRSQSRQLKDFNLTNLSSSSGLPPSPLEMLGLGFGTRGRDQERGRKQSTQGQGSVSSSLVSASSSSSLASTEGFGDAWAGLESYAMYNIPSNSLGGYGNGMESPYSYIGDRQLAAEDDGEREDPLYKASSGVYGFGAGYRRDAGSDDGNGALSDLLADAILKRPETMRMGSGPRREHDANKELDKDNVGHEQENGHTEVVEFTFPSLSHWGNVPPKKATKAVPEPTDATNVWVEKAPSSPPPTPPEDGLHT
ncbi:hypothetical protein Moror_8781 [Moniliophthora roreri MCA 2997]|uniref:Uncharacterized protein n=1 Tax=Moniliophthora roreri (strain MCA 2997) TaxID=1381753 RepID=V2WS20_MONRO|nr:hypothetical protein Moror_8781 [Moniliophthora roreri MCA 2997]